MTIFDTKEMILKKTFQLLLLKGYDGVSISDIQKATGMARGLLYHYFGNKETLFVEVTRKYFMSMFLIDLNEVARYDVEEMIVYTERRYNDVVIQSWEKFELESNVSIMNYDFLFYRVMQQNQEFAREYLKAREIELEAWTIVLENSLQKGLLREGIEPAKMARNFIFLQDGIWLDAVNRGSMKGWVREMGKVVSDFYRLIKR